MKKFFAGLLTGLILTTTTFAFAADPIKLIVNGQEIAFPDAPPQIINGRTMVPARPLAEALGAKVDWDNETRTVVVSSEEVNDASTDISNSNDSDWIDLRTLADIYGVYVEVGDHVTLRSNSGKEIKFPAPRVNDNTEHILDATPTLKIKVTNARFYFLISELQKEGLIHQ